MPKVSVITPVYNGERFISTAINSLLSQTYSDWELIVVNDGSTDNTVKKLEEFADPRIQIFHQNNRGEAGARNTGLEKAAGQYVSYLDADDVYLPDSLGQMVNYLDGHPEFDVIFSNGYFCDENGEVFGDLEESRPGIFVGNILEQLVVDPAVITVPVCTMTRRSIIEKLQLKFDTNLGFGTDWEFWIRMSRYAKFGYLDYKTCMYRVHQNNMTNAAGKKKRQHDLMKGRLKVMKSDYFQVLPETTRYRFFYQLLIDFAEGEPDFQKLVLESEEVKCLSIIKISQLWRRVGIQSIVQYKNSSFSNYCLTRSSQINPSNWKTKVSNFFIRLSPPLAIFIFTGWEKTAKFVRHLSLPGHGKTETKLKALHLMNN